MRAIEFKEQNKIFKAEGCFDLPAYNDGVQTITKWQFSAEEMEKLRENDGCLYLSVLAGPSTPPVAVFVDTPFFEVKNADCFCEIAYTATIKTGINDDRIVYNHIDAPAPPYLRMNNREYIRDLSQQPRRTNTPLLRVGDHYIRATTPEERAFFEDEVALVRKERDGLEGLIPIPQK